MHIGVPSVPEDGVHICVDGLVF